MIVPSFLLRRLYVRGSLKNTPQGFRFALKNSLGSGYAQKMLPVSVDGQEFSLSECYFELEGKEVPFSSVSESSPFTLEMGKTILVKVNGSPLSPGSHKIGLGFVVPAIGRLSFEVTDVLSE